MATTIDSADFEERVEEILYSAIDLKPGDERERFLESACAGDARLRAAVGKRLAGQTDLDKFFQNGAALPCAREISRTLVEHEMLRDDTTIFFEEDTGKRIGAYTLRRKLGEGGCGSVYLAEQEFPVRREVAFKIIKLGMDTKRVIARFEVERQALALMEHPNIAHVLDAGATETGRPYFVMELVRGVKITDYCDEHRLDIRQRLDLFMQVCNAIQHAHQKGIIHRDIKPSNVLVTEHDNVVLPKVIDFGIAKATEAQLLSDATITGHGQFIGTPAYMSPEQAETGGLDVDTRSDIYSLGVLLYELCSGAPPFDQEELLESGPENMRRILREREPQRPSAKLNALSTEDAARIATARKSEPHRLKSLLKGDLDWIVMKALEKDRSRRYHSASGFAADLERYCANEPVTARSPSRMYRFRKLVRRNRVAFAAIGAVSAALIAGFTVSSWLFFRERAARQEAEHARQETDQARRAESTLRTASEARANIARAAYLLSHGRAAEADALVEKIPISINEPSLEAANVYRTLADWNLRQNRWEKGVRRLLDLIHANQMDKTDMTYEATRDLLVAGPALVFAGNLEDYHRLVQEMVARFAGTQNPQAAEQVLKFSLILPVDAATLRSLEPVANVARKSMETERVTPRNNHLLAWRAFALSLFDYRSGNFDDAVTTARRCLGFSKTRPTTVAMAHLVMGMSLHQLHREREASSEIRAGEAMVRSKIPVNMPIQSQIWGNDETGYWYDWIFARILLREAEALIK